MAVSHIAASWLVEEGRLMRAEGTPRRPALIGGSGLCGTNLLVLLASAGSEELVVIDARPPSPAALAEAGIESKRLRFVKHLLGSDSEEALASAIDGCDCVFAMVTPHVQFAPEHAFYKTNIDGVQQLVRACEARAVPRLVYLSSIAATNHFVPSVEQSESQPLPAWESYFSPYDITKRKGEEMILAANSEQLKTCALRPASILLSPYDFTMANVLNGIGGFDIIPKPAGMQRVDFIDGRDVVRALLLASQSLVTRPTGVSGEAFFVTKARGAAAGVADVAAMVQGNMGWPFVPVPLTVTKMVAMLAGVKHVVRKALGLPVPGIAPNKFIEMAFSQQTFDNSKAQAALGFQPKVSIAEAVSRICDLKKLEKTMMAEKKSIGKPYTRSVIGIVLLFFLFRVLRLLAAKR